MKVKLDHVTNSSSTGYVFYGFAFDKSDKIFQNILDKLHEDDFSTKYLGLPKCVDLHISNYNEGVIIGKSIMYMSDDGGIEEKDVDLNKLIEDAKQVAKVVKDTLGLTREPKLIGGVDGQG